MSWSPAPPGPIRQRYEQVNYRSDLLYEFRARDGLVRDTSDEYPVRSGQGMVWTRGATASVTDSNGDSITIPDNIPALSMTDGEVGWKLGSDDLLWCPWNAGFQEMSGVLEFVQVGALDGTGDPSLWHIGQVGFADYQLRIIVSSANDRLLMQIRDDTDNPGVQPSVAASDGDVVRLRWELENTSGTDYRIRLHQTINGGAEESSAWSDTVDMSGAWPSTTRHYIGSRGSNPVPLELRKDLIAADLDYDWSHE